MSFRVPEIELVSECHSTHDLVVERLTSGLSCVAVRALTQHAGRGRNGRGWVDDDGAGGCLLLSVACARPGAAQHLDGLSVRIAGAVAGAITALGGSTLRVKYPNDLVTADGSKVGGVLVDSVTVGNRIERVVMSVGLNVTWSPDLEDRPTACLADIGYAPEVRALADEMCTRLVGAVISP